MAHPASDKPVVQTVPSARAGMVVAALVALLAFAFTITFAHDRHMVIITAALMAALYPGITILILPKLNKRLVPPPQRIDPVQLPPAVGIWKANFAGIVLIPIVGVAFVIFCLFTHEYVPIGVLLGLPIIIWDGVRRAKRTEYELHGILWHTAGIAWTSKSRIQYLVARA